MKVEDVLIENSTIEDAKKVMQKMFDNITLEQFEEIKKQAMENVKQNNMSAKEMFIDLNFKQVINNDEKIVYRDIDNPDLYIVFYKLYYAVDGLQTYDYFCDYQMLQAINKQVEELGWLGDKE